MNTKKLKIYYRVFIILFSILMVMDGFAGIAQQEDGRVAFKTLGYPMYFMVIIGVSKILGVIGILQSRSVVLREWAYAGFTFNFIAAGLSWAIATGDAFGVMFPVIGLILLFIPYFLWKKMRNGEPIN